MNDLDQLVTDIAAHAVPDEKDLAPILFHAFIDNQGQNATARRSGESLGGFGGSGIECELPSLLEAIKGSAPLITSLFAFAATAMALITEIKRSRSKNDGATAGDPASESEKTAVNAALIDLKDRLIEEGFDEETAEKDCKKIILIMLEKPETGNDFLKKLLGE